MAYTFNSSVWEAEAGELLGAKARQVSEKKSQARLGSLTHAVPSVKGLKQEGCWQARLGHIVPGQSKLENEILSQRKTKQIAKTIELEKALLQTQQNNLIPSLLEEVLAILD